MRCSRILVGVALDDLHGQRRGAWRSRTALVDRRGQSQGVMRVVARPVAGASVPSSISSVGLVACLQRMAWACSLLQPATNCGGDGDWRLLVLCAAVGRAAAESRLFVTGKGVATWPD
jgi:hypothetical protein